MYHYISGKLTIKTPAFAVIDVNGIGYEVKISLNTYAKIKDLEQCTLYTYLQVKEDLLALYGFYEQDERTLFLQVTDVQGIGPTTALVMLSSLTPQELRNAILTSDLRTIQSVKGIGAKTAQRVILELKDKIAKSGIEVTSAPMQAGGLAGGMSESVKAEAIAALVALFVPKATAEKNVATVLKQHGNNLTLEELIKLALKTN